MTLSGMHRIPISNLSNQVGGYVVADCQGVLRDYHVCMQNLSGQLFLIDDNYILHIPNEKDWVIYVDGEEKDEVC